MRNLKVLIFFLFVIFLLPVPRISAASSSSNPGYIVGTFNFPGFTTTSLSLTAVGGGDTSQMTRYNSSNYLLSLEGGDWNYAVTSSCGLSGGNNNALTVSFNQRSLSVAAGETVTNDYVYNPGIIRFQVNITGDPTISSFSAGSWATKTVASGEKTATFSSGTPATSARTYTWDLPVVANQQIELTAKIDVSSASGVKRYSFSKSAASPYNLLPINVAPGQVVIVPLEINFLEGIQPPAASLNKGFVGGTIGLLGLPSNNFVRHTANGNNLYSNPAGHSRQFSFAGNQTTSLINTPFTYFNTSIDSELRWPYIDGILENNRVTVYPDTTQYLDFERAGGLLTGKINLSGTVKNEDLKAITFNFNGLGRVYTATNTWEYLENYYGSATLKRDSALSSIKPPTVRDYRLFLTTGPWEISSVSLTKKLELPSRTSTVAFIDHNTRYDGQKYFGTPLQIEEGLIEKDLDYCTGSAIFRFRDPAGRLVGSPTVSGKGSHLTNGVMDLDITSISATSTVSNVAMAEVELFGPPGDYTLSTLRIVAEDGTIIRFPNKNISLTCNATKIYDMPGPTLNITSPQGEFITNAQSLLISGRTFGAAPISSVTVNDGLTSLTPVVGGNANEVAFTHDLSLTEGENHIAITATDSIGAQANDQLIVYVDRWLPTVSIITPVDGSSFFTTDPNLPLNVEAVDRGYGYSLAVYLDGILIHSAAGAGDAANPVPLVYNDALILPLGEHVITATVTDKAGNSVSASSNITIKVYEPPPVLSGLNNQVIEAISASGAAAYFAVTATSECDPEQAPAGPPAPILTPQSNSTAIGSISKTFRWSEVAAPDGHPVQYQVQVSKTLDFAIVDYSSAWQSGTSWTQLLPNGTWFWRVTARDSIDTELQSSPAVGNSFDILQNGAAATKNFSILNVSVCVDSGGVHLNPGPLFWAGTFDSEGVDRSFLMFDTSSLGAGATVTAATLNLDYQNRDYLAYDSITQVHESTWEIPGAYDGYIGNLLASQLISVGRPFGNVAFNILPAYIKGTGITKFAVKAANEDYESLSNSDPGYNRATSYLGISYTTTEIPWGAPILTPQNNATTFSENTATTFQWGETPSADGDPVQYLVEISSAANFSTINFSSSWQAVSTWTQSLPSGTWYWRVTARDALHTAVTSNPAASSFILTYSPPALPGETFVTCSPGSGEIFPLGVTTVTCVATDACNGSAEGSFTIGVHDNWPPNLTLPENMVVEASSAAGAVVLFDVSATDIVDLSPVVTCLPASGSIFPVGVNTVGCTARDASGNLDASTFTVTVNDALPPVLTVPADKVVEAMGLLTPVEIGQAMATHHLLVTISNDAPDSYPVGSTDVTWTATAANGKASSGLQNITITDSTVPVVTAPANLTIAATGSLTTVVTGLASASDAVGVISLSSDAPIAFPLGTTVVTWTARDAAGNTGTAVQSVLVIDQTPPLLAGLTSQTLEATSVAGAVASFTVTASDSVDPAPVVVCSALSGSTFPLGATIVNCTATDASGNSASGDFTLTIQDTSLPLLTLPADVIAEATAPLTLVASNPATATDLFPVTISNDAPDSYPVGFTAVTWAATDTNGNRASGLQNITIIDSTDPVVTAPANLTIAATGSLTPVVTGLASASDAVGVISLSSDAPIAFPLGTTVVTWTARDAAGNTGTAVQSVLVIDQTPPLLAGLTSQTLEATSVAGAVASFTVTASDTVDPAPVVACSALSGSTFPLGATIVNCTATDASGNSTSGDFTLTVRDTTEPVLTVPANITVLLNTAPGSSAVQAFLNGAIATDTVDAEVTVTVTSPPTLNSVGTKSVTFTATDASGNQTSGTATIRVIYGGGEAFLPPVSLAKPFKAGSTVPVKIEFSDAYGTPVTSAVVRLALYPVSGDVPEEEPIEIVDPGSEDIGSFFKVSEGIYHYNLRTKNLGAGTYQVRAILDDGTSRAVMISLKN